MLWMEIYLFYCSVRLGVIVVAVLAFIQVNIPAVLLLAMGMNAINPIIKLFQNDYEYGKSLIVRRIINWIENNFQAFTALIVTTVTLHMVWCILAIFGALKLKKWLLLPFIVAEFGRVIFCFASHIILMIILKKKLNLGFLIAVTLAGGFVILYLGYNWAASVALYQIIELVHSERYHKLYGDDPFNPQLPPSYTTTTNLTQTPPPLYGELESARVDEQKQAVHSRIKTIVTPPTPVIAVLPANYRYSSAHFVPYKQLNRLQQKRSQQSVDYGADNRNDYNAEFGHWQWSELMVGGRQRRAFIKRDW